MLLKIIFPTILLLIVASYSHSYEINADDVYKKQLEIQQEIKDKHEDIVSRISYKGDRDAARADLNDLRCDKYFLTMKDYGKSVRNENLTEPEIFFKKRFEKCMNLQTVFWVMTYDERITFYRILPREIQGIGKNPYKDVWRAISVDKELVKTINDRFIREGNGADYLKILSDRFME